MSLQNLVSSMGVNMARSSWLNDQSMQHVLAALMPANRLVMRCCLASGLRVSDVLEMRTSRLARRMTIRERKTGKSRRITWPASIYEDLQAQAGRYWVFEGRCDPHKHRTRQTVYKDVRRAAAAFRRAGTVPKDAVVSPHSARKIAAVHAYHDGGLDAARKLLNHSSDDAEVTLLYALADHVASAGKGRKNGCKSRV